jgi:hypothetical protein
MKVSLLIDYEYVIKRNKYKLESFIRMLKIPISRYDIGIFVIIPLKVFNMLNSLNNGNNKIEFLNNTYFLTNIIHIYYIIYNKNDKICEILDIINEYNILSMILYSLSNYFPSDIMIWTRIQENNYEMYSKNGFNEPFLCGKSPLNTQIFEEYLICMYKRNIITENTIITKNDIINVVKNYSLPVCKINIKFTNKTLDFLKNICITGEILKKNGKIVQKEIAGSMMLVKNGNFYDIEIVAKSLIVGKNEGVDIAKSRYNFHSHPRQAYIRHDVIDGHPSGQDYKGYLQAIKAYGTAFHCVASLEGIYTISLKEYWCNKVEELSEKKIYKYFDIGHITNNKKHSHSFNNRHIFYKCNSCLNLHNSYLEKVNNISINKEPIFTVRFDKWNDVSEPFTVCSPKIGFNCLISDESYLLHRKFYNTSVKIKNPSTFLD